MRRWTTACPILPALLLPVLLPIVGAAPAAAAPADIVAALKGGQPTLYDLSIASLRALIHADSITGSYEGSAYGEDERIVIWTSLIDAPEGEADRQELCRTLLDRVQRLGGVDPATGWPDNPASAYASLFSYPGHFTDFDVDETYAETVDSMIELRGSVGVSGDGEAVSCRRPLLSKDTEFGTE